MKPKIIFLGGLLFLALNSFAVTIDFYVHFEKNRFTIADSIQQKLEVWALTHYHQRHYKVYLYGHTDEDADNHYNEQLSADRNTSVRTILEQKGFDNIEDIHFGETRPLCFTSEESCMAQNRRVEIHLIDDQEELWQEKAALPTPIVKNISAKKENIIQFPQGTTIKIEPNSFITKNGDVVDDVRLEVRELYDIASCLNASVTTQCGDKLLESGGMIEVRAFKGQEELSLSPNHELKLAFAQGKQALKGMQTFYGQVKNGKMEWDTNPGTSASNDIITDSYSNSYIYSFCLPDGIVQEGNLIIFPKKKYGGIIIYKRAENKEFLEKFMSTPESNLYSADFKRLNQEAIATKDLVKKEILLRAQQRKDFEVEYNRSREEYRAMKAVNFESEDVPEGMDLDTYIEVKDSLNNSLNSALSASKLGWINCDRYLSSNVSVATIICNSPSMDPSYSFIILPATFSIMASRSHENGVKFVNMPTQETRYVIYKEKMIDGTIKFAQCELAQGETSGTIETYELIDEAQFLERINSILYASK